MPARAFQMEIAELELDDDINQALSRIDNVGELMVRMLADEDALSRVLKQGGAGDDAMEAIRYALDDLVILGAAEAEAAAAAAAAAEAEAEVAEPKLARRSRSRQLSQSRRWKRSANPKPAVARS